MFDRSDSGSHDVGDDLQSGQRGVYASCNPGNRRFKAVVEPVCGRASHIYERNRTVPASDRAVFCGVPGIDPEAFGQKPDENPDRSGLYLYRSGTVFDRRKRRLYAGGQLSGTGAGGAFPSVGNCADCDGDGLLHRKSGACRLCPEQTG